MPVANFIAIPAEAAPTAYADHFFSLVVIRRSMPVTEN